MSTHTYSATAGYDVQGQVTAERDYGQVLQEEIALKESAKDGQLDELAGRDPELEKLLKVMQKNVRIYRLHHCTQQLQRSTSRARHRSSCIRDSRWTGTAQDDGMAGGGNRSERHARRAAVCRACGPPRGGGDAWRDCQRAPGGVEARVRAARGGGDGASRSGEGGQRGYLRSPSFILPSHLP